MKMTNRMKMIKKEKKMDISSYYHSVALTVYSVAAVCLAQNYHTEKLLG